MENNYKRKEDESELSYIARMYRQKIELGLNNKEINAIINKELGTNYAESTTRGKADVYNKCLDEVLENNTPKNKMDEIKQLIGELDVKTQIARNKENKLRSLSRKFIKTIEISNDIKQCIIENTNMPIINGDRIEISNDNKLIVHCGDWHIGYVINGYKGNYYNYEIAKKRLGKLKEEIRKTCKLYNINKIYLVHCGDHIENTYMRENQSYECEMDLSHQIVCASKLLYMFATELSQLDEGKNVDIISVGGNHNRLAKNKECNIEGDNVNVIIVENLKTFNELTKNNRINILDVDYKDDSGEFEVNGVNVVVIHGDNRIVDEKKLFDSESTINNTKYKLILRGHFHNFNVSSQNDGGYIVTCGSLFGYNPYSVKKMGCTTNASQTLIVVGENDVEMIKDVNLQIN